MEQTCAAGRLLELQAGNLGQRLQFPLKIFSHSAFSWLVKIGLDPNNIVNESHSHLGPMQVLIFRLGAFDYRTGLYQTIITGQYIFQPPVTTVLKN